MKKARVFLLILTLLISGNIFSQIYALNNGFTNGGQVRTCAGIFKDSNPAGDYANNENYKVTFNTASAIGQAMQLDFDTLDLAKGDTMFLYDGSSSNTALITFLTSSDGAPLSVRASANNRTGSLTIIFKSDNFITASGWSANLACKSPCQQITAKLTTNPPADANGFINICKGSEVTFSGSGTYNQNDIFYHQTDTTAKFLWSFSDGKDTSGIFAHQIKRRFNNEGGTIVQLALMDENECYNLTATQVKVRTSLTPSFNINEKTLCINDTIILKASPAYPNAIFSNLPVYSDSKPLADGVGKCYETSINITKFAPNQKLLKLSDLDGILINMEHSWLGDFTIAITAPNGAKVFLKKTVGTTAGWETYLGEPVDEPSLNSPLSTIAGKGYDYLFSPTAAYGTMKDEKGKYKHSYTDNAGQVVVDHTFLPEGSYAAEESLSGLLGTTLNGLWTIEVCDNFKEDNGFIFYWTIKFKPSVYPDSEIYTTNIASQKWTVSPGLISAKDSVAVVSPPSPGTFKYQYALTDNFGCMADTIVQVNVNTLPAKPYLGADTVLCPGKTITLQVANPQQNNQYVWSSGLNNASSLQVNKAGIFSVQSINGNGCKSADTITVLISQPVSITLGKDTIFCASNPNVLSASASANVNAIQWNTGATTTSITAQNAGIYWVRATSVSGCTVSDSMVLSDNPVNQLNLPADTTICVGTGFQININNVPPYLPLLWNDGSITTRRMIYPGQYSISTSYLGCAKNTTFTVGVKPIPKVNLGNDTTVCIGINLPLSVTYPGAGYLWSNGSTANNIVAQNEGRYWVQTTLNGCTFRDSLLLTQRRCQCNVRMPNAFSPNGDGINDVYKPEISCYPKNYKLSVFNRYGQLLFNSTEINVAWDGTFKSAPLPVGTYYYILDFYNIDLQKLEQYKGAITLLK